MIHDLILPPITKERLLSIVQLQITLLEYAASDRDIGTDADGYIACRNYLNNRNTSFKGYGEQIARAIWKGPERVKLLQEFSLSFHKSDDPLFEYDDLDFRYAWLKRIRREIENLADPKDDQLKIYYFYGDGTNFLRDPNPHTKKDSQKKEETAPSWQQKAGRFFLYFYKTYIERSKELFPADIFPYDAPTKFGRQDLLQEFRNWNKELQVCPICDESGYYTQSGGTTHAILDHYLPKDIYPHFACHPYNLIPTCYPCNSSIKGIKDPLHPEFGEAGPGYLHRDAIPYAPINRKEKFYLKVDLSKGINAIRIIGLQPNQPMKNTEDQGLYSALDILQRVYDIPGRWSKETKNQKGTRESKKYIRNPEEVVSEIGIAADRVSEALFRRMRHFLGQGKDIMSGNHMIDELYDVLSLLLYYLSEEDRYKDPLTIPMLWTLAALLAQEQQHLEILRLKKDGEKDEKRHLIPAALNEVLSWCGQDSIEREKREEKVRAILALVAEERSVQ